MLSSYIFLAVMIALFVLYIVFCREKSVIFALGLVWFLVDISTRALSVFVFSNLEIFVDLRYFNVVNLSIALNVLRNIEAVFLFAITICYFISRKRKQNSIQP